MPPALENVLETCLYVADMDRSRWFYEQVLGLRPQFADERMTGYRVGNTMLLLFLQGATDRPVRTGNGTIPAHGATGPIHFAFCIDGSVLKTWIERLAEHGIDLESKVTWPNWNAESLYFRDPDENLVELATRGLWGID